MRATDTAAEPLDVIAILYELFGQGRLDETFDLMDPEVRLVEPGDPDVVPWAGEFHGHDGLRRFYDGLATGLSSISIDPETLRLEPIGDDRVLALGTERGTSARTGESYITQSAWVWTVRDGRVAQLRAYHDTEAMTRALRPHGDGGGSDPLPVDEP